MAKKPKRYKWPNKPTTQAELITYRYWLRVNEKRAEREAKARALRKVNPHPKAIK